MNYVSLMGQPNLTYRSLGFLSRLSEILMVSCNDRSLTTDVEFEFAAS
jgi:hypothetical protein